MGVPMVMEASELAGIRRLLLPALAAVAVLVAGCASTPVEDLAVAPAPTSPAGPSTIPRERLVGSWGIASFHVEKDRKRTEAEARSQCGQPYRITLGPTDGVMMHAADDPKLYELRLKGGPGAKTYLGFDAPAGDLQDREIVSISDSQMVLRFVDPDANRRYGTFIYIRCRAAA